MDISKKMELHRYISHKNYFSQNSNIEIKYLSGGVSSTVALVTCGGKSLLIKQALAKLKVSENWECDQSRVLIEKKALDLYDLIVPGKSPRVIDYDDTNYILIREAVGEDFVTWKSKLQSGDFNYRIADDVITALSRIHNETANSPQLQREFDDNRFFYELRINPYIEFVSQRHPALKQKAADVCHMLMTRKIAVIHGDYSPKNILVKEDRMCIIDHEVACLGHPCFDLAFLFNHFLLKSVHYRQNYRSYLDMLEFMIDRYFDRVAYMDRNQLESDTVRVLAFLFLARIDGKSKIEYITDEREKNLVRSVAITAISQNFHSFSRLTDLLELYIKDMLFIG